MEIRFARFDRIINLRIGFPRSRAVEQEVQCYKFRSLSWHQWTAIGKRVLFIEHTTSQQCRPGFPAASLALPLLTTNLIGMAAKIPLFRIRSPSSRSAGDCIPRAESIIIKYSLEGKWDDNSMNKLHFRPLLHFFCQFRPSAHANCRIVPWTESRAPLAW